MSQNRAMFSFLYFISWTIKEAKAKERTLKLKLQYATTGFIYYEQPTVLRKTGKKIIKLGIIIYKANTIRSTCNDQELNILTFNCWFFFVVVFVFCGSFSCYSCGCCCCCLDEAQEQYLLKNFLPCTFTENSPKIQVKRRRQCLVLKDVGKIRVIF